MLRSAEPSAFFWGGLKLTHEMVQKWAFGGPQINPINIYIYAVELLSGASLAFEGLLSGPSLFLTLLVKKHITNRGFSAFVLEKKLHAKI